MGRSACLGMQAETTSSQQRWKRLKHVNSQTLQVFPVPLSKMLCCQRCALHHLASISCCLSSGSWLKVKGIEAAAQLYSSCLHNMCMFKRALLHHNGLTAELITVEKSAIICGTDQKYEVRHEVRRDQTCSQCSHSWHCSFNTTQFAVG